MGAEWNHFCHYVTWSIPIMFFLFPKLCEVTPVAAATHGASLLQIREHASLASPHAFKAGHMCANNDNNH